MGDYVLPIYTRIVITALCICTYLFIFYVLIFNILMCEWAKHKEDLYTRQIGGGEHGLIATYDMYSVYTVYIKLH